MTPESRSEIKRKLIQRNIRAHGGLIELSLDKFQMEALLGGEDVEVIVPGNDLRQSTAIVITSKEAKRIRAEGSSRV